MKRLALVVDASTRERRMVPYSVVTLPGTPEVIAVLPARSSATWRPIPLDSPSSVVNPINATRGRPSRVIGASIVCSMIMRLCS